MYCKNNKTESGLTMKILNRHSQRRVGLLAVSHSAESEESKSAVQCTITTLNLNKPTRDIIDPVDLADLREYSRRSTRYVQF